MSGEGRRVYSAAAVVGRAYVICASAGASWPRVDGAPQNDEIAAT